MQQAKVQKGPDQILLSIEMYRTGGAKINLPHKLNQKELGEGIKAISWGEIDESDSLINHLKDKNWIELEGRREPRLVNAPRVTTLDRSPIMMSASGGDRTFGWEATPTLTSQGVKLTTKFREFKSEDEFTVKPFAMNFTLPYGKERIVFVESDEANSLWRFIARPISKS